MESALLRSWNSTRHNHALEAFTKFPAWSLGAGPVPQRRAEVGKLKAVSQEKDRKVTIVRDWRPGLASAKVLVLKRLM